MEEQVTGNCVVLEATLGMGRVARTGECKDGVLVLWV